MAESVVRASSHGVLLRIVVTPNAPRSTVRGVDPWRHAFRVSLDAKPAEGAANAELIRFLADRLRVSEASIRIVAGHTSRRKTVAVAGLTQERVLERLKAGGA